MQGRAGHGLAPPPSDVDQRFYILIFLRVYHKGLGNEATRNHRSTAAIWTPGILAARLSFAYLGTTDSSIIGDIGFLSKKLQQDSVGSRRRKGLYPRRRTKFTNSADL
jgi:hypothetical protein